MFKKICVFYAFSYFFALSLLLFVIIFGVKIRPIEYGILLALLGLTFSFPVVLITFFLARFEAVKVFWAGLEKSPRLTSIRPVIIFSGIFFSLGIFLFSMIKLVPDRYWPKKPAIQKKTTPTPTSGPVLTGDIIEYGYGLEFKELGFTLDGSLFFLEKIENVKRSILLTYKEGNNKQFFDLEFGENGRIWKPEGGQFLAEFFYQKGKSRSLFEPNGNQRRYDFQTDSFIGDWAGEDGYLQECFPGSEEKELCFKHRSVYFGPLEHRGYSWDGRFFYRDSQGAEEEILTFDYADLKNIWQSPNNYDYQSDDCFSTTLVGFFDQNSKALLALVSESTANECGDASGWCGFYVADLNAKTLAPFKIDDFGPDKKAQKYPYFLFSDPDYFVYCPDKDQIAVQDLSTGQKRFLPVKRVDPANPKAEWTVVEFKKIGQHLYIKADWDWTKYFDIYFDLEEFKEIEEGEAPVYLKNSDGYWNPAGTQYAWEEEGKVFVYDDVSGKTETLLDRDLKGFFSVFHLAGWGY